MSNLQKRIDAMFARDKAAAAAFVIALWLVVLFVFVEIRDLAGPAISAVLFVSGTTVVLFNSASITAMIRHYQEEKSRIYGLDIEHLDAMRAGNPDALGLPTVDEVVEEEKLQQ